MTPDAIFETITPEVAERYLEANTHNRPLKKPLIRRYVRLMERGAWHVTPDGIAFDDQGRLINGQHRLHAIIQHGQPITMLVVRGLKPEAFRVLDHGTPRSGADVLAIEGYQYTSALAAALRLIIAHENDSLQQNKRVEHDELLDAAARHPLAQEPIRLYYNDRRHMLCNLSHLCFVWWAHARTDRARITQFFDRVVHGVGIQSEHDSAHLFRSKLERNLIAGEKLHPMMALGYMIIASNMHMRGEQGVRLRWPREGFPTPDAPVPTIGADQMASMEVAA